MIVLKCSVKNPILKEMVSASDVMSRRLSITMNCMPLFSTKIQEVK